MGVLSIDSGPRPSPTRRALRVATLALSARTLSALLAWAALSTLRPYDAAGPLTFHACDGLDAEKAPSTVLSALSAWDGAFFGRAARCGPAWHEQALAFAPATALAVRVSAAVGWRPEAAALVASWTAFVTAAVALDAAAPFYVHSGRNSAALLLAFGPASPFATALYAEAWHAAGLGLGLLSAAVGRPWASALCLGLATASRSTGAAGACLFALATPPARPCGRAADAFDRLTRTALALTPLVAWQAHAWWVFCAPAATSHPAWCDARPLPLSLPAVQAAFWSVGPGKHWTLRNVPNFVLAAPALAIAAATAAGAGNLSTPLRGVPAWALRAHTAFLAVLVVTSAHVQVATRLLALGAPGWIFGLAASGWASTKLVWAWAGGFAVVGGVLHATWYPWT